MKKENVLNLIKSIVFLAIAVVMVIFGCRIFQPKTSDPKGGLVNANARAFYGEPKNSLDVVVLGNSNAYSAYSPMYVWGKYGIPTYVAAEGGQNIVGTLDILNEILTCQKPKVVVLDVDLLWEGMNNTNRLEKDIQSLAETYIPLIRYHDRWKSMQASDSFKKRSYTYRCISRGQYLSRKVMPYKGEDVMAESDGIENIPILSRFFLDKLVKKCREESVDLVFVEFPTMQSWNYEKHNAMVKYTDAADIEFLDMNLMTGKYKINWSTDTRDAGRHLNCYGARKTTAYLADYLTSNYAFEDKRKDSLYAEWNEAYKYYKKVLKKGKIYVTDDR